MVARAPIAAIALKTVIAVVASLAAISIWRVQAGAIVAPVTFLLWSAVPTRLVL